MTKRSETAAATRARILAVARTVFNDHPYADMTVRRIARAAGVSTGAVMRHWPEKVALYAEAIGHPPITPEQGREWRALAMRLQEASGG